MTKVTEIAGKVGTKLRDRRRSVQRRLMEIGRASRSKGPQAQEKVQTRVRQTAGSHPPGGGQAKKFSTEIGQGIKQARSILQQARVFDRNTHAEGKLVSLFEPDTEIIRKGKASKPTEFGKLVKIQEAENQIIIAYEVYAQRPNDHDLLVPAVALHEQRLERVPELVAGDAGFYSAHGEPQVLEMGVKRISIPNHSSKSLARRRHQNNAGSVKGRNGEPVPKAGSVC